MAVEPFNVGERAKDCQERLCNQQKSPFSRNPIRL